METVCDSARGQLLPEYGKYLEVCSKNFTHPFTFDEWVAARWEEVTAYTDPRADVEKLLTKIVGDRKHGTCIVCKGESVPICEAALKSIPGVIFHICPDCVVKHFMFTANAGKVEFNG